MSLIPQFSKKIGALQIGQTPRPDLVTPLETLLPDVEIIQAGALDGLTPDALPDASAAPYPLTTIMEGQRVLASEDFLAPRLQTALNRLETQGVFATILLCAGTFAGLSGTRPLVKPFDVGLAFIRSLNLHALGFIAPFRGQETPIRLRWEKHGFKTTVWAADIANQGAAFQQQLSHNIRANGLQAIVLDYVGHPHAPVQQLQHTTPIPVIDLGNLAMRMIGSLL